MISIRISNSKNISLSMLTRSILFRVEFRGILLKTSKISNESMFTWNCFEFRLFDWIEPNNNNLNQLDRIAQIEYNFKWALPHCLFRKVPKNIILLFRRNKLDRLALSISVAKWFYYGLFISNFELIKKFFKNLKHKN